MKTLLIGLVLGMALFAMPAATQAAGLIPCGTASTHPCQSCDVVTLANNVIGWLVGVLSVIAVLIIVYAGVKLVTAGGNRHSMEEAKSMMTNLLIGYVIVLAGWLIIDFVMKSLLDVGKFGVWNQVECIQQQAPEDSKPLQLVYSNPIQILANNPSLTGWAVAPAGDGHEGSLAKACAVTGGYSGIPQGYDCTSQINECRGSLQGSPTVRHTTTGDAVSCTGSLIGSTGGGGGVSGIQCSGSNSACSVSVLMSAGLNSQQANIMSCIAVTESSGDPSNPPYNQIHPGSNSTACGTFSITKSTWNTAPIGSCTDFSSSCQDARCNINKMVWLVKDHGYRDWTCRTANGGYCNKNASGCVSKYGG